MTDQQSPLGKADLEAIRARWARATPGPWRSYVERRDQISGSDFIMTGGADIYLSGATTDDQDFIASAYQDIPKLLAEIERLKTEGS
jgi:hypothetical protein